MSGSEVVSLLTHHWFVIVMLIVHAVLLIGFFAFIANPGKKSTRIALAVTLFGVCGGTVAVVAGWELAISDIMQLVAS